MFQSGYVALVGVPNVGKSTLINQLIGQKLAIVSPKPQTTRHRILGILHRPNAQVLFLDTPGIHSHKKILNRRISAKAEEALQDADVAVHLIEPRLPLKVADQRIAERIRQRGIPHLVVINKVDQVAKPALLPLMAEVARQWQPDEVIPLSALKGEGSEILIGEVAKRLPEGPAFFPEDQYTDQTVRFLCEELLREKAFALLHEEIPYGLTSVIEKFDERDGRVHIHGVLVVERESHKAIVVGAGGRMIKEIGTRARTDMEAMLGKKVFLELFVKVVQGWSGDPKRLNEYGI